MKRLHAHLTYCAFISLLGLWPGYAAAVDSTTELAVPPPLSSSGIDSRAIPSPLQSMMMGLQLRLTQLEADARATQTLLNLPGSNPPAIVTARFPQLAAIAGAIGAEARLAGDQARIERQAQLAETANRIAADSEAIRRGMDEARARAQQATQAATQQLLTGIISAAAQMKGASIAMLGTLLQNTRPLPDTASLATGGAGFGAAAGMASSSTGAGAAAGAAAGGAASAAIAAGTAAAGGAAPATGAGPSQGGAAGASAAGAAAGGAYQGGAAAAASGAGRLGIDQQVLALQQQLQALQAQLAILQSVLKIAPNGAVTILSPTTVTVQAGMNISIQSTGTTLVEGRGGLDLNGTPIKLNGGTKPIATIGSQVQVPGQPIGLITTGNQTILAQ